MFPNIFEGMRLLLILAATLASILNYVSANGLPKRIPDNTIFAQMDGQIYKSEEIKPYRKGFFPSWMQKARILESMAVDVVYLRPESGTAYEATLLNDQSEAAGSSSHSTCRAPVSVRIHIKKNGHNIYYKADNFQIEPISNNQHLQRATNEYPRKNYIYIARRRGPVYSAPMIDYTPYIGPHHNGIDRPDIPDADGLRILIPNNNILVHMDGRIYQTKQINLRHWVYCPGWLQQGQFLNLIDHDSIYIRPHTGYTYEATLSDYGRSRPSQAMTHNPTPRSVRIHIVQRGYHTFYRAGIFVPVDVPHKERAERASHEYPPEGYIYIVRKGGPVFRAPIIEFIPPQGPIPSDMALHLAVDL